MITLKLTKKEQRIRDKRRQRASLRIGNKTWHLTRREVLALYNAADRYLMATDPTLKAVS